MAFRKPIDARHPQLGLRIADACQDSPLITLTACRDLAAHARLSLRTQTGRPALETVICSKRNELNGST